MADGGGDERFYRNKKDGSPKGCDGDHTGLLPYADLRA
eukprot:gene16393-7795_t